MKSLAFCLFLAVSTVANAQSLVDPEGKKPHVTKTVKDPLGKLFPARESESYTYVLLFLYSIAAPKLSRHKIGITLVHETISNRFLFLFARAQIRAEARNVPSCSVVA